MYHVVSTGVASIILYLISYFFTRAGFYSISDHRKFWNIVLAISFLCTLAAGLFLALQITYKWNVPFIKTVLKWHVECGIALSFTGIFHFMWHLSYFRFLFGKTTKPETEFITGAISFTKKQCIVNLLIIGFVSTSVQLLLIREIMNFAGGYELITGTFLGSWIIGSSVGSSMAKRSNLNNINKINLFFALSTPSSVLLLLFLEKIFLSPGETPSYLISVIMTLISLFPLTFVSGFTFVKLIGFGGKSLGYRAGRSFSFETIGSIIAGITVAALLAGFLNTYQLLIFIIVINITYVLVAYYIRRLQVKIITITIAALISVLIMIVNTDIFFRQLFLGNIKVLETKDTPYGNITTGEYRGEKSIYYNQRLYSYPNDEIEREENIHYAMLQHNDPEYILLISGDIKSNLKEVLKYNVKKVVFVERDPALLNPDLLKNDTLAGKLYIINDDPLRFIRHTDEVFDVVLLFLPPPSTLLINRFYTTDFFSDVKKKIRNRGIFMCSPGSGENYYNKESVVLYSSIVNSLRANFKNVKPVVGNKLYFISSDGDVSASICALLQERKIKNAYVNSDYLSDDLMNKKSNDVSSLIDPSIRQNTEDFPVACFHYQSYNLSKNINERIPALIVLTLVFGFPVFSVKRRNLIMFSSAAALAGFEIITLIILQTVIGNMYLLTGLVIAALMSGMAVGSYYNPERHHSLQVLAIGLILTIFYIVTGLFFRHLQISGSYIISLVVILVFIFIPAALTGQLFNTLTKSKGPYSDASSVYSADLRGSALGFVLISGYLVPAAGISTTIILLSALIFGALIFGTIGNKY